MRRAAACLFLLLFFLFLLSCDLPRDARGTLRRVTNGRMKVGFVSAPPWVIDSPDGARELDLVIAGLKDDVPWRTEVAFSRPYFIAKVGDRTLRHVVALPPGENAWLMRVDRHVYEHSDRRAR
jgi:hypothetical protein